MALVRWLANVWGLGWMLAIVATLAWFVYWVFLRRMIESREDPEK